MKIVGVADSDSYLKWGASVLGGLPEGHDTRLFVLATPAEPSAAQFVAAMAGTGVSGDTVVRLELAQLAKVVAEERPDVVFLALRGPVVRVVLRAIVASSDIRPVFVSGMPGISFPATKRALLYRSQVDLLVVHSKRERDDFSGLAERLGIEQRFGLATLAFLRQGRAPAKGNAVVFATQAKVPRTRDDRMSVLRWLSETAAQHPELRVVIKLRARGGEQQTHAERYPYDVLAAELGELPSNLVFETGPMADHLDYAVALVTVSSTAALEAAARGIPALVLNDFGVSARLINLVFDGSNLLGGFEDLIAARFPTADPVWLDQNYFHSGSVNDWFTAVEALAERRKAGELTLRAEARRGRGGALRDAWDRKRVLGQYDRSIGGRFALAVGIPARWVYLTARGMRRARWRARDSAIPG